MTKISPSGNPTFIFEIFFFSTKMRSPMHKLGYIEFEVITYKFSLNIVNGINIIIKIRIIMKENIISLNLFFSLIYSLFLINPLKTQ